MPSPLNILDLETFIPQPGRFSPKQIVFYADSIFAFWELAADWVELSTPTGRGGFPIRTVSTLLPDFQYDSNFLFFRFAKYARTSPALFSWFVKQLKEKPYI